MNLYDYEAREEIARKTMIKQSWDIILGAVVAASSIVDIINRYGGAIIIVITVIVLLFRLRREWKFRNYKPPEDE